MKRVQRTYTVHEVVSMLEEDSSFEEARIYIEPPEGSDDTDEDSGEEDGGGTISNLNRRQLISPATATVFRNGIREDVDADDSNSSVSVEAEAELMNEEELSPVPSTSAATCQPPFKASKRKQPASRSVSKKVAKVAPNRDWRKIDLSPRQKERFKWNERDFDLSNLPTTPTKLFEVFFDDEVVNMIVEMSQTYARSKGNITFFTSHAEVRVFLAVLLVSGYNTVPRRRMFWSCDDDVRNPAISSAITRNRFDEMIRFLHLCDNANLDTEDKMAKVRPLLAMLNERFLFYFKAVETQNLSIDESMVPYFGRHGAKQFIRSKPIRFGYKMWALTTPLGYLIQTEPYQGAKGRKQPEIPGLGMGGSVAIDLISELQQEEERSYHLTFDNLFTSLKLVDVLTQRGMGCTGTIRANRLENCPLKSVKEMEKEKRGAFDQATDIKSGLSVVRWHDNNIVNTVSNVAGVQPLQKAKRWSRAEGARVEIPQPFVVKHYNKTMGGVDRMDQNVEKYRTSIRSKKWWWPLFAYWLDVTIQQTWHLYRARTTEDDKSLDLLGIRRSVARVYLACAVQTSSVGRPQGSFKAVSKRVPPEVRFDRMDHMIEPWKTQLRCGFCGKKAYRRCKKCKVGVHDKCFSAFHTP